MEEEQREKIRTNFRTLVKKMSVVYAENKKLDKETAESFINANVIILDELTVEVPK